MADVVPIGDAQRRADHAAFTKAMDEGRLELAVRDGETAAADFAVLTAEATKVTDLYKIAYEANRLAAILLAQSSAAQLKAQTL